MHIFRWSEGLSKVKIKKKNDYFEKYKVKRTESWDKVWGISMFSSCTPIRGIYRKSLLSSTTVRVQPPQKK